MNLGKKCITLRKLGSISSPCKFIHHTVTFADRKSREEAQRHQNKAHRTARGALLLKVCIYFAGSPGSDSQGHFDFHALS